MTDVFSKEKCSKIMSKVKSKGNKSTEIKLINIFKYYQIKGWEPNYTLQDILTSLVEYWTNHD